MGGIDWGAFRQLGGSSEVVGTKGGVGGWGPKVEGESLSLALQLREYGALRGVPAEGGVLKTGTV